MPTLILKLAAPMQSWGTDSVFETRRAGREPSKSGVIGMIAAALGRSRTENISDLAKLRFGVRIDQVGTLLRDYHTVHDERNKKNAFITNRYYLQDACFLVGLEGEEGLLRDIEEALTHPYYPLFLGRRSCPPTGKLVLGITELSLLDALRTFEWTASLWYRRKMGKTVDLEIVYDTDPGNGASINDNPVSFDQRHRLFSLRNVCHEVTGTAVSNPDSKSKTETIDWFSSVKGAGI